MKQNNYSHLTSLLNEDLLVNLMCSKEWLKSFPSSTDDMRMFRKFLNENYEETKLKYSSFWNKIDEIKVLIKKNKEETQKVIEANKRAFGEDYYIKQGINEEDLY